MPNFNGAGFLRTRKPILYAGRACGQIHFNGAGFLRTRKLMGGHYSGLRALELQWSRVPENPETYWHTVALTAELALQWSRVPENPETSPCSRGAGPRPPLQWSRVPENPETPVPTPGNSADLLLQWSRVPENPETGLGRAADGAVRRTSMEPGS